MKYEALKQEGRSKLVQIPADISKNYSDNSIISEMIKTLEIVKKNGNEMNEKITEQQANLEKLIKEIDQKNKFVGHLDKKIVDLEQIGKQLEESLYFRAETNKKMKKELKEILDQKKKIQSGNMIFMNQLKGVMGKKVKYQEHEDELERMREEYKR